MTSGRIRFLMLAPAAAVALSVTVLAAAGVGHEPLRRVTVAMERPAPPPTLKIGPVSGTTGAPASTEIDVAVTNGTVSSVVLVDAAGTGVAGSLRTDGSAWVPAAPLGYGKTYTATVVASGASGASVTETTTFTTRQSAGWNRVYASIYLRDGATYGIGMPVVVEFDSDIPEAARPAVQRRIFVKSEPAQPGGWHWYGGKVAMYRPMSYWTPGTKLSVRAAVGGLPIGNQIGDSDESASVTIGRSLRMEVDNATKQMSVIADGNVTRTIPVSLGKPSTPSSSGTMVVMSKEASTIFDTTRTDGPNGYRVQVYYAQRLTWGGEYIHAAPWSEGDQGHRNVSHGCINVSMENAKWLFDTTLIGDPITIRGTETALTPGNGWTAWETPWSEFSEGSTVS